MSTPKQRIIRVELSIAVAGIERALLLSKGDALERDIERLLEAANATAALVEKSKANEKPHPRPLP